MRIPAKKKNSFSQEIKALLEPLPIMFNNPLIRPYFLLGEKKQVFFSHQIERPWNFHPKRICWLVVARFVVGFFFTFCKVVFSGFHDVSTTHQKKVENKNKMFQA